MTDRAPSSGRFEGGAHLYELRVFYEDTDAAGIVYYANYLKFIERGRTEMMRLLGFEHSVLRTERSVHWAVRRCTIEYRQVARLDETLVIESRILAVRGASLDIGQLVLRGQNVVADAVLELVCIRADGRAARLPAEIRARLAGLIAAPR